LRPFETYGKGSPDRRQRNTLRAAQEQLGTGSALQWVAIAPVLPQGALTWFNRRPTKLASRLVMPGGRASS
jgi:hypothetical protein